MFADEDRASWRTRNNRAERDLAFLTKIRALRDAGDLRQLAQMLRNHTTSKHAARWKVVALSRCLLAAWKNVNEHDNAT